MRTVSDEGHGEALPGLLELLLVALVEREPMKRAYRRETYGGQEDEVGVILILVNLGDEFRVAVGDLLRGNCEKMARYIGGIGVRLATVCEGRQSAVRVLPGLLAR